jgi:hypothetical protein
MLSADFFGLDLDFNRHKLHGHKDDDFFEQRAEGHDDGDRHRVDDDRLGHEERRSGRSLHRYSPSTPHLDDGADLIVDFLPSRNVSLVQNPVVLVIPARTVFVSIINVPVARITLPLSDNLQPFPESDDQPARSVMRQQTPAAEGEQTTPMAEVDVSQVDETEPVIARSAERETTTSDGMALVSTVPMQTEFDHMIVASHPEWWTANSFDGSYYAAADIADSQLGRWLHRAGHLNDQLSVLDRALAEITRERAAGIDQMWESPAQVPQATSPVGSWLTESAGIALSSEWEQGSTAAGDVQQTNVVAEGWTVGIGFHRALEIAGNEKYADAVLTTIQRPTDAGSIRVSSDESGHENLTDTMRTTSSSELIGVAICVVGLHYLRARHRPRGIGDHHGSAID